MYSCCIIWVGFVWKHFRLCRVAKVYFVSRDDSIKWNYFFLFTSFLQIFAKLFLSFITCSTSLIVKLEKEIVTLIKYKKCFPAIKIWNKIEQEVHYWITCFENVSFTFITCSDSDKPCDASKYLLSLSEGAINDSIWIETPRPESSAEDILQRSWCGVCIFSRINAALPEIARKSRLHMFGGMTCAVMWHSE